MKLSSDIQPRVTGGEVARLPMMWIVVTSGCGDAFPLAVPGHGPKGAFWLFGITVTECV